MPIVERIRRVLSLTMVVAFAAYGLSRCVSYISYVTNFGLMNEPHGYISTIPFMVGASLGVIIAGLIILVRYLSGALRPRTISYKVPIITIAVAYGFTLLVPGVFENAAALTALGLLWGITSTYASTAAIEFLAYEQSPVIVIISLAGASLLTALMSILIKIYPALAGPLDVCLAIISLVLIGVLRKKTWSDTTVQVPRKAFKKTLRLSIAPILASAIFELVVGLINMFSFTGASSFQIETDSPIVGMLISGVVVTLIVAIVRRAPRAQVVYSVIYPAAIGIILLLPFFGDILGKAASTLLYSAYLFTSMLSMFCCLQACRESHDCVYGVMAVLSLILRLCLVVGLSLGWWLGSLPDSESFMKLSLACVICIYFLGLVLVLRNAGKRFLLEPSQASESVEAATTAESSELSAPSKLAESVNPAEPFESAKPANTREPAESPVSTEPLRSSEPIDTSSPSDLLTERLDELTSAYGLTNRERDVLLGLAQGNTAASIAEELCLSTSTVQSYTKTLYAKLGINKKQQVIDLVMKNKEF